MARLWLGLSRNVFRNVARRIRGIFATSTGRAVSPLPVRDLENGGTQIRTGDTTIFSRVLYQLSYPAEARER